MERETNRLDNYLKNVYNINHEYNIQTRDLMDQGIDHLQKKIKALKIEINNKNNNEINIFKNREIK